MNVCSCTCMYKCTSTCMYECMYVYMYICMYINVIYNDLNFFLSVVDCEVSEWSEWSGCSVHCGKGTESRQKLYKTFFPRHSKSGACTIKLF